MIRAALALLLAWAAPAWAVSCQDITYRGTGYTICEADPARDDIRLFLETPSGGPFGQFAALSQTLEAGGKSLVFAMNAGMYHADRAPVGYYVEDGQEKMRVLSGPSTGNFGLLPNGILCLGPDRADVIETLRFLDAPPTCRHATQSGPMLVIDGALHPRFLPDSTSRYVRNGVGSSADGGRLVFAISNAPVTFYDFGLLFRDHLALPQALYLDGSVSKLHAPALGRSDFGRPMGPIIGVVAPLTE